MKIQITKLRENAKIPTRGSERAAGYDLYACLECDKIEIAPHTTAKIGTGLALAVPDGYFGAVFARSGLAAKEGLRPANCVGVCDSDYRGEIKVALINHGKESFTVTNEMRIAQLVVTPILLPEIVVADELSETERNAGGFGSTGQ